MNTMSKAKPTKVPTMKRDQPYKNWRKELLIWQVTNSTLEVDKKVQGGVLFQSLEGIAHQIVLSELTVHDITSEDGVDNIIRTLDYFFMGDSMQITP